MLSFSITRVGCSAQVSGDLLSLRSQSNFYDAGQNQMRVLITWMGQKDLDAMEEGEPGPITSVLDARDFDHVVILSGYEKASKYREFLQKRGSPPVHLREVGDPSFNPTDYSAIHDVVMGGMNFIKAELGGTEVQQQRQAEAEQDPDEEEIDPEKERMASKERRERRMEAERHSSEKQKSLITTQVDPDRSRSSREIRDIDLSVHVTPGTPHMHAMWVLITKQWYPEAELIQSSKEEGVKTVEVPFHVQVRGNVLEHLAGGLATSPAFDKILGTSNVMQTVKRSARRVASHQFTVLIEGESGTGKELVAQAIHSASNRKDEEIVAVNCGALPEGSKQSELFGHKKGAFTGAINDHKGYFEQADKGTLFLDEIGELPLDIQVMLLRVIQEQEVRPMGATKSRKVNVRLIAATNKNLKEEVRKERFRGDLLHRLAIIRIQVPPLRERGSRDVGIYIDTILAEVNNKFEEQGLPSKSLSDGARDVLLQQSWASGNYRELENTVIQLLLLESSDTVVSTEEARRLIRSTEADSLDRILGRSFDDGFQLENVIGEVVGHYLDRAFQQAGGAKKKAAELVGFRSYQRFDSWIKKYEPWITFTKK